jgi:helix-turn-helix protein
MATVAQAAATLQRRGAPWPERAPVSVESISVALHHSHAAGTAKLVLVGIANHDGDGGAWPSIATLAKYAGRSRRAVQYAIRQLEALGEINVIAQEGGTSETRPDLRPNLYEFLLTCPPDCDGTKRHGVQLTAPGAMDCTPGAQPVAPHPVQPVAPEPSFEPSVEPEVPPTPTPAAQGPARCRAHRDKPHPNCRRCGTSPRVANSRAAPPDVRCEIHLLAHSATGECRSCAADRKATG